MPNLKEKYNRNKYYNASGLSTRMKGVDREYVRRLIMENQLSFNFAVKGELGDTYHSGSFTGNNNDIAGNIEVYSTNLQVRNQEVPQGFGVIGEIIKNIHKLGETAAEDIDLLSDTEKQWKMRDGYYCKGPRRKDIDGMGYKKDNINTKGEDPAYIFIGRNLLYNSEIVKILEKNGKTVESYIDKYNQANNALEVTKINGEVMKLLMNGNKILWQAQIKVNERIFESSKHMWQANGGQMSSRVLGINVKPLNYYIGVKPLSVIDTADLFESIDTTLEEKDVSTIVEIKSRKK